jgi:hypothetical protein
MARKRMHLITTLHLLLFAAAAMGAAWFFWTYDCAPALLDVQRLRPKGMPLDRAVATARAMGRALIWVSADCVAGIAMLTLLYFGSRFPVARLVTWVQARGSGDVVELGGNELSDEAVLANDRKGTVLR